MSDQLKKDIEFIRSMLPVWLRETPRAGLNPVFYGTGSQDGDIKAQRLVNAALERLSTPPCWTPIEEAGEWDGEMEIELIIVIAGVAVRIDRHMPMKEARDIPMMHPSCRLFVYPAPPPFNPEDYEVKP